VRPARRTPRSAQSGAFLLEALVGILIFAFGVLGIVGLQAQSMRTTNESQYRAEAAYLANTLLSEMWADDVAVLKSKYDSSGSGSGYVAFKGQVKTQLGAAWTADPDVKFDDAKAPSSQSAYVTVTVPYLMPGDTTPHQYVTSGVVGQNP
jgi:type IV pilus assembly protein PilV